MNSYSQYNFKSNDDRGRRQYNDRNAEEPEWFSGGPTSQNDTIELRGFEEYGRRDSPTSRDSAEGDEDKATADYESDTDKTNHDNNEKSNDNNNNDKAGNEDVNHRDGNADKVNDFEPEDIEVANAEPKPTKKDDNFNFEDFMKTDGLTDLMSVSAWIRRDCK